MCQEPRAQARTGGFASLSQCSQLKEVDVRSRHTQVKSGSFLGCFPSQMGDLQLRLRCPQRLPFLSHHSLQRPQFPRNRKGDSSLLFWSQTKAFSEPVPGSQAKSWMSEGNPHRGQKQSSVHLKPFLFHGFISTAFFFPVFK